MGRDVALPAQHTPSVKFDRRRALGRDEGFESGTCRAALEPARLIVEALDGAQRLLAAKLCAPNCRLQHPNGVVIDLDRNRVGMPVLAAVGEREARGILKAI